ncbi:YigZ family protein [Aliidiomarina soli]|uniref:YigZ family protein n=1 Tax=Aliidiomarina soli TaxID=1928574 RepID=A0A432WLC5_9GAMM|nr:YigZ family protein [Aliidiomarina soli]RUO34489.1 YigZ family protein [Aliidiomarina soli]
MTFKTAAAFVADELVIKKSRFIGWAAPAATREEALQWVAKAQQDYPDARHHCWAYLLGRPEVATHAAANDDGEPSGTAGKPMLNVIQHKGIGNVVVIAIRYFGGIKLGAGGLLRAYSGTAERVLSQLPTTEQQSMTALDVRCDFAHEQVVRHFLEQHQGQLVDIRYSDRVQMRLEIPDTAHPAFVELTGSLGASIEAQRGDLDQSFE